MHGRPRLSSRGWVAAPAGLLAVLAGCASPVEAEPGPQATHPLCAHVMVSIREGGYDELAGLPRRDTGAQSTAAWGDPPVVLRCGVEPPGPTTDPCLSVSGVDWVLTETDARAVFTTYGRTPAVEVALPTQDSVAADAVLADLSVLASRLPQQRECL